MPIRTVRKASARRCAMPAKSWGKLLHTIEFATRTFEDAILRYFIEPLDDEDIAAIARIPLERVIAIAKQYLLPKQRLTAIAGRVAGARDQGAGRR